MKRVRGGLHKHRFFSPFALTLILQQVQIVGIVAAAQSIVILTAGIDLSVGAVLALSTVVTADLLQQGMPVPVAIVLGLGLGAGLGLANGLIITKAKINIIIIK